MNPRDMDKWSTVLAVVLIAMVSIVLLNNQQMIQNQTLLVASGAKTSPTSAVTPTNIITPILTFMPGDFVIRCGNASCSQNNTVATIEGYGATYGDVGIKQTNLPYSSYAYFYTYLRIANCTDPVCSTLKKVNVDENIVSSKGWMASEVEKGGLPFFVYRKHIPQSPQLSQLVFTRCLNTDCTTTSIISVAGSQEANTNTYVRYPEVMQGADGFPNIVFYIGDINGRQDIFFVKCQDANCQSQVRSKINPTIWDGGFYPKMALGNSGNPVITYRQNGPGKIVACGNPYCNSGNIITNFSGWLAYPKIIIGKDNLPLLLASNSSNGDLNVLKCLDPTCSSGHTTKKIAQIGNDFDNYYTHSDMKMGRDGLPLIAYYNRVDGIFHALKCNDLSCNTFTDSNVYQTSIVYSNTAIEVSIGA